MLSTNATSVTPVNWQSILANSQIGEVAFVTSDTMQISTFSEGGFINGTYSPIVQNTTSGPFNAPGYSIDLTIADLLSRETIAFSDISNGAHGGWLLFDSQGTNRLAPSVIIALNANGNFSVIGHPFVDAMFDSDSGNEGGPISIELILKAIGPASKQSSGPTMLSKSTMETQPGAELEPNAASAVGKLTSQEITGEWARAAVFEIAGGEPTRLNLEAKSSYREQKSTSGKSDAPRETQPVTSQDAETNAARLAARNAAAQRFEQPLPADENRETTVHQRPGAKLSSAAVMHSSDVSTTSTTLDIDQSFGADAPPKTSASTDEERFGQTDAQVNEAIEAALEQLTAGDDVLPSSSTDYRAFRSSIGIMPALLMLALERVAPRNWRRRRSDVADEARSAARAV